MNTRHAAVGIGILGVSILIGGYLVVFGLSWQEFVPENVR